MTPLGLPLFHYDGGKWIMGSSPQAYNHLKSFQRIELQVVLSAPRNQLLSAHQLLYETNQCCVICKLQKSYRRGSEGTTSVGVQRVHQWRQITNHSECYRCRSSQLMLFTITQPCVSFCFCPMQWKMSSKEALRIVSHVHIGLFFLHKIVVP